MSALNTESLPDGARIRPAGRSDVPVIIELIRALAEYEKLAHAVVVRADELEQQLFDAVHAEVVLLESKQTVLGFALFFHNFSTFAGRRGLYLEDLYVRPEARGRGYGLALMKYLARTAVHRGCARFEWSVLDWNEPAISFYRSLGAVGMNEWTVQRLDGEALLRLAR